MTPQTIQKKSWVEQLTQLNADPEGAAKRGEILDGAASALEGEAAQKIKEGLTFEMEVLADTRFKKFMQAAGLSATKMKSLTGDAEEEIDTHHDLPALKAISAADLKKAVEALQTVSNVSEKARAELLELRFKEAGYAPAKRELLEKALQERAKNGTAKAAEASRKDGQPSDEELNKFAKDSARIGQEVDETVADEVWTPLVRQGVMPENLVPDRYSNVKRTFSAASQAYQERLEEYSKGLDDNADLLAQLGVGKEVSKQCADLVKSIAKAIPGAEHVTKHVEMAAELFSVVAATSFTAAQQGIQKKDAQEIVNTVLGGVAGICGTAIPNPTVAKIVSGSITGAISAGRGVRAIVDRKPDEFLDALSGAVNSALSSAAVATKNPLIKDLTPLIVGTIKGSSQTAKFVAACNDGDKEAIKKALGELINSALDTVGGWTKFALQQTGSDKSGDIGKGVDLAVKISGAVAGAAVSDKGKVTAFAAALGTIANGACSTYLKPPELGKSVGALLNASIGTAGPGLVEGIKTRKPDAVLKIAADLVAKSLETAAAGVESEAVKKHLEQSAKLAGSWLGSLSAAAELGAAIKKGDFAAIDKASKSLFQQTGSYVTESLRAAGLDVEDLPEEAAAESDESAAKDGVAGSDEAKEAKKQEAALLKKLKAQIAAQDKILGDDKATPEKKEEAAAERTKAVEALREQKQMKNELAKDAAQFSMLLNLGLADEDPDDDGMPPPKIQDLILQLQKDRKIFELVDSLSGVALGTGVGVLAQFFPATGAIIDFQKFSIQVIKAVQHVRELLQWLDNAGDARAAVTVQVHAMLSRVGMEKRQALEASSRAALALVAGIGQVVAATGAHAAPVGVALTAGARIGESSLEIIKKVADETEMEAGWKKFKAAMANPRDRKNARAAIESNPTLAKYTLAWGALHGNDAIAKEALRKCGLNDAVLRQEDTNVKEVQKYLEEMFNEDLVVLRAVPVPKGWYPSKKPALTLRSWTAFLNAAYNYKKEDKINLAPGSGGAVSQAVAVLDNKEQEFKKAQADYDKAKALDATAPNAGLTKAQEELVAAVTGLQDAARGFTPLDAKREEHKEMREYLDALVALGDIRLRELDGETVALEREAA